MNVDWTERIKRWTWANIYLNTLWFDHLCSVKLHPGAAFYYFWEFYFSDNGTDASSNLLFRYIFHQQNHQHQKKRGYWEIVLHMQKRKYDGKQDIYQMTMMLHCVVHNALEHFKQITLLNAFFSFFKKCYVEIIPCRNVVTKKIYSNMWYEWGKNNHKELQ